MPRLPKGQIHPLAPAKGRPQLVKCTPELVKAACDDIRRGLPIESALVLRGVTWSGMDYWRKRNPAIEQAFKRAEVEFESDMVNLLRRHAEKDAKAAQWLTERRLRGNWQPAAGKVEVTGKDGGAIQALTISKVLLSSVAQAADLPRPMVNVTPQRS